MHLPTFIVVLVAFLVGILGQSSPDVTPFILCPNECKSDFVQVFKDCRRPSLLAGCLPKPCDGGFECAAPPLPAPGTEVLPGGEIVFEKAKIYDEVRFYVNFTGSRTDTDLYLLSDATGSMSGAIANVKSKFTDLINSLKVHDNFHVGVGLYRNEAEAGHDGGFINLQGITSDDSAALDAVNKISVIGCGDSP